jgi:hypothetical protein
VPACVHANDLPPDGVRLDRLRNRAITP